MITPLRKRRFMIIVRKHNRTARQNIQPRPIDQPLEPHAPVSLISAADAIVVLMKTKTWGIIPCKEADAIEVYELCGDDGYIKVVQQDIGGRELIAETSRGIAIVEWPFGLLAALLNDYGLPFTIIVALITSSIALEAFTFVMRETDTFIRWAFTFVHH